MRIRLIILNLIFLFVTAAVTVRLFALQVLGHEFYKSLADNQHQVYKILVPVRGDIFVKGAEDGQVVPAVSNIDKNLVFAVPQEITDKVKTAQVLAPVLELDKKEILEKISDTERKWVPLKKELGESTSRRIEELKLGGVYLQAETYRLYPEKVFASQVLGFLGYDDDRRVGRYGVEEYFQNQLAGTPGSLAQDKDLSGRWITSGFRKLQPAQDGADIFLTIDRAVQFKAEEVLRVAVEQNLAENGNIVVMSPRTGAILAIANYPTFDPNEFGKVADHSVFRDGAISDTYESGSVFKAITMAAGLNEDAVTPDTTYIDTGAVPIDKYVIKNAENKVYGEKTKTQDLEQSINTGVIFVQDKVGPEKFLETIKNFGFGSPSGITLPSESGGAISNLIGGGDIDYATAAFGQGITVTLLQLAQAFSTIANQGTMMKPYLVQTIRHSDGSEEQISPQTVRQVISPQAANTLAAMLVSVVENGHGKRAGVPGYYIAGKTGTAQVARTDGPGYDPNKTVGTFAGFGPVDDPAFVIVVKIVNPKTVQFAESTAAPAFGELAKFLLNYFQIPPRR